MSHSTRAVCQKPDERIASKVCSKCKVRKFLTEYYAHYKTRDRRRYECKACTALYASGQHRKRKFGLTAEQVAAKIESQGGHCPICESSLTVTDCAIDHDHQCCPGKETCGECLRDALCYGCNHGLGKFGDDPERMIRAARYVQMHRERTSSR